MRKAGAAYLSIFRLRFALQWQYRAAAWAGLVTNFFFGVVRVIVIQAFFASSGQAQPMTLEQTVTYTWLTQITFRLQPYNLDTEMLALIRSGNLAYELCRPVNLYLSWYSRLLAYRLVPAMLTGIPIYIIVVLLPGSYRADLPASVWMGCGWLAATAMATLLSCALSNLVSISALWTITGDGMQRLFPALIWILSGTIVPLAFFPDWAQTVLRLQPFSGLADLPFRIYLGLLPDPQIAAVLGLQLLWTLVFVWLGVVALNAGIRRVVVQGG